MKSNKGITLVALVITIIVLLILAGVSIALVVGDNGVLTQSKNSSNLTKKAQMEEAIGLAIVDCQSTFFNAYTKNASVAVSSYINPSKVSDALAVQGYALYTTIGDGNKPNTKATSGTFSSATPYYIADKDNPVDYMAVKVTTSTVGATTVFADALSTQFP